MLSEADKARIADAIRSAEARTSGEIVCVLADSAGSYRLVPSAWAAVLALIVPLPLIHLTTWSATTIYVIQLLAFIGVAVGLSRQSIRLWLVPGRTKRERAHAAAVREFWAQGLHRTEGRTGVLIYAAVAERYVEIVADGAITMKATQDVWDNARSALVSAIRAARPADGFVAAIEQCGAVLATHFPAAPGALNPDELPNRLVEI